MPRLKLPPSVTLLMTDGTCPDMARQALIDTLEIVHPIHTLVVSPVDLDVAGTEYVPSEPWNTVYEHCEWFWYKLPPLIHTDFVLMISWDGWVIDAEMWDDRYLDYDFIGAPWAWYDDNMTVGNGLGMRSKRLMDYLKENRQTFPYREGGEDGLLCRQYRPALERCGFKWAPEWLASKFSFEDSRPAPDSRHFMFHGNYNFKNVLSQE